MRTLPPALRTLPSRRFATRSDAPIFATSCAWPLKAKEEVRAGTRRPGMPARALRISSERPSEKYSLLGSSLMFTKGKTATDAAVAPADEEATTVGGPPRTR